MQDQEMPMIYTEVPSPLVLGVFLEQLLNTKCDTITPSWEILDQRSPLICNILM